MSEIGSSKFELRSVYKEAINLLFPLENSEMICLLTYSMEQSPSEKLTVAQPFKKFTFFGTKSVITVLARARHWSVS